MSQPARPTVIAENQTAGDVFIADLGLTVPASSSLQISDFAYSYEIQGSLDLYNAILAGDILINDGVTTLTMAQSLQFVTGVMSAQDLQDGVTGPASATLNQIPKFDSTTGKSLTNSGVLIDGSNNIVMGGAKVTGLGTPTAATDAATKGYVDAISSGLSPKASVLVATTANIVLSGAQTIDGIGVVAGDRVLVKDQTIPVENGIYVAAAGAWSRSSDMPAGSSGAGVFTFSEEGTANADIGWICTSDPPAIVGTDPLAFSQFSSFQLATVAPPNVSKSAAAVGTSTRAAREDHKHDIDTAAPTATAVEIGNAASQGTATTLARSDHTHTVAGGSPVAVGTANADGTAATFSRSDHVHNLPFAVLNTVLGTASAAIGVNAQKITNLADPTAAQDAATKAYVDAGVNAGDWKPSVRAATTANITLSGAQTIDGVSVIAGDRVLVKNQSTTADNGIYVAAAGAWTRSTDADSSAEVTCGMTCMVEEGTTNGGSQWTLTTANPITLGTTGLTFSPTALTNVAPVDVTKAAAAVGTSVFAARADHKHDVTTAAPAATGVATASGEGTATTLARSDHTHQSNTAPVNVTKAAAAIGTSGEPARADHKHDVTTAAPTQGIGGGNTEGTATSLARSDHDHKLRETSGPTELTIAGIGDGEIIRRTGTTIAGGVGRTYPASATDPSSPTPSDGDRYYNTSLKMQMSYDGSRSKWLSDESAWIAFGRNGNTAAASYYRGSDGLIWSSTLGQHALFNGTVIGMGYTRSDSDAATFEQTASGVAGATLASSAVSGRSTTLNTNFAQGDILAVRNQAGGNTTSDVQGWMQVKWRA